MVIAINITMTTAEMRTWFDILSDKYNTPYFTDAEKDEFLTDAQWDFINEYIGDDKNPVKLEKNKSAVAAIKTLIVPITASSDANGLFNPDTVTTGINALLAALTPAKGEIILPLSIKPSTGKASHFLSHNDIDAAEDNDYKKGVALATNYTISNSGYQLYPTTTYSGVVITCLVAPTSVDELPEHIHRKQVAKAMTKTGLVIESQALTLMEQVTNG